MSKSGYVNRNGGFLIVIDVLQHYRVAWYFPKLESYSYLGSSLERGDKERLLDDAVEPFSQGRDQRGYQFQTIDSAGKALRAANAALLGRKCPEECESVARCAPDSELLRLKSELKQLRASCVHLQKALDNEVSTHALTTRVLDHYKESGWKNTDPRLKPGRKDIVVLRPVARGRDARFVHEVTRSAMAEIVGYDEEWPEDWWWVEVPKGAGL